ncbi:MAG TPA: SpoIIE family protein phosphatase [Acholeplasmataceae bacterium]|nr:SpoIIE family protein phosphatase [Acholeplasmataceae bacterium]
MIFYAFVSTFLLACFYFNQENSFSGNIGGFSYNELLLAIISIVGATSLKIYDLNLGLCVAIYFSIYFASNEYYKKSIFFNLVTMIGLQYYFKIDESYIIIIVGSFYYLPKILSTITLFIFSLFVLFADINIFSENLVQASMIIGLFFECVRFSLVNKIDITDFSNNVYENVVSKVNTEVVSFASFLDKINKDISYSKGYFNRIQEAITNLYRAQCEGCSIRKDCLSKNKGKLYYYYKDLIIYQRSEDFSCSHYNELKRAAYQIANRFNLIESNEKNDILSLITSGISIILRQFCIETSMQTEIDYRKIYQLRKDLSDYGFTVSFFNVKSAIADNFLIEVGLYGVDFNEVKSVVKRIAENELKIDVSLIYKNKEKNKVYFNIVPEIKYEVTYGYGALAPLGNNVCGDNYLVKQLNNSKLIAAISDGMGKGIKASMQSSLTLKLIDEITNMNFQPDTALQILNTLIYIQDYQEIYSTLDFVEINRQKGEGTFYKAGGTTTYLFHQNGEFEKIENDNLPFGLEEMINVKKMQLKDDDLIIIASDGIFENIIDKRDLEEFINSIRHLEPQKLIYELLNYARYSNVVAKDDMSVIALKIKEN